MARIKRSKRLDALLAHMRLLPLGRMLEEDEGSKEMRSALINRQKAIDGRDPEEIRVANQRAFSLFAIFDSQGIMTMRPASGDELSDLSVSDTDDDDDADTEAVEAEDVEVRLEVRRTPTTTTATTTTTTITTSNADDCVVCGKTGVGSNVCTFMPVLSTALLPVSPQN